MYAIDAWCMCTSNFTVTLTCGVPVCSAAEEEASGETIATPEVGAATRPVHDASPGDAQTCR